MYIRKKNNENSRIKRPAKRTKPCDMFFTSGYGFYLKPIAIFSALLTLDFIMEIRIEYLWSCWLFFKSVSDSYKYQGLVFSLFFMLIVLTSDIICYLLIPVTWVFFIASSYAWIQLVGHTERGICLPILILCVIFMYVEYLLRLRNFSYVSLSMEICRPFSAHGVGYPIVTMGFGLKSYVTYKFRMRKQRDVEAENRFVFQLIDQALPDGNRRYRTATEIENETSSLCDDSIENSSVETPSNTSSNLCNTNLKPAKHAVTSGKVDNSHSSDILVVKPQSNGIGYVNQWTITSQSSKTSLSNGHVKTLKPLSNGSCISDMSGSVVAQNKRNSVNELNLDKINKVNNKHNKDDITRLESDIKRLRGDLQSSRANELDLRNQLSQVNQSHLSVKIELNQCRQDLISVQNKLQSLQQKYQSEKQNNQVLEKKLNEEKKNCQLVEQQLTCEKKARKEESDIKSKALQSATLAAAKSSECTESCKSKRRQLENDIKLLKKEKQNRDDQIRSLEQQLSDFPRLRKLAEEYQQMAINISNLTDEKEHLVRTLSDENKIKQNLITAYHNSLKEVNALNEQLTQKDYQILQLNINGVPEYITNHQSSYHHQQLHRQTPMTPSSSPLMDDLNFYTNTNSSILSSSLYTTMMGSCGSKSSNNCITTNVQISQQKEQKDQQSIVSSTINTVFSTGQSSSGLMGGYSAINSQSRMSDSMLDSQSNISNCNW